MGALFEEDGRNFDIIGLEKKRWNGKIKRRGRKERKKRENIRKRRKKKKMCEMVPRLEFLCLHILKLKIISLFLPGKKEERKDETFIIQQR